MASKFFVDIAPLRKSRDYRFLFIGQTISVIGNAVTVVALPFQTYQITHSSLQVGLVSLAQLIPLVLGSLIGGAYGDAHDRRRIILIASLASALSALGLTINAWQFHSLAAIYVISACAAFFLGFANPARASAIPMLIGAEDLVAANSLNQMTFQIGSIAGPALAGLIIASAGLFWTYSIDTITFLIYVLATVMMRPLPPTPGARKPGIGAITEGFRFLKGRQIIQGIYVMDLNAMIFGAPVAIFPALAAEVFKVGPTGLGLLYAAPAIGAFIGAGTTGWVGTIRRRGRGVVIAIIVWGLAIAGFGCTHVLWMGCVLLALAGWADVISAVLRGTMLQLHVPDEFRGRLSSIQMAVVQGGPRLGNFEAGAVAAVTSTGFSVISGGLACVVGALALAKAMPRFWHETPDDEPERL